MSINSSSSLNAALPPFTLSFSISDFYELYSCYNSTAGLYIVNTFTATNILVLLPLYMFVLYLGHQQRRPGTMMSHSDLFTIHMVIIELIGVLGTILNFCGILSGHLEILMVSFYLFIFNSSGQMFFHILTCVERYLAVVHPTIYMSLRKAKWIRIRNITISCGWLLCFAGTGFMIVEDPVTINIIICCIIVFMLSIVSFCSLSVLCVLIRPGPGEGGGGRHRVDQLKLRAFYTIMAILGVLLLRSVGDILAIASTQLRQTAKCAAWLFGVWYCLPSSLVLPLLFLQRARKLLCCKNNNKSVQGSD